MHKQNDSLLYSPKALDFFKLELNDEASTCSVGKNLGESLDAGLIVWLDGDLGVGKTTLVRAMLRHMGITGPVKSPTYSLVEVYVVSSLYLYHFDFYRFNEPEEFIDAGLDEYFQKKAICLVEWPHKAAGYVPKPDLLLSFRFRPETFSAGTPVRTLEFAAYSEAGQKCLSRLKRLSQNDGR